MKTKKKVSTRLAQQIESGASDDDLVDVIIELEHESTDSDRNNSKSRSERINERKESFARILIPVENVISEVGGTVLEKVWLNHTLRAKVPVAGLKTVSKLKEVEILDAPHNLESDN